MFIFQLETLQIRPSPMRFIAQPIRSPRSHKETKQLNHILQKYVKTLVNYYVST